MSKRDDIRLKARLKRLDPPKPKDRGVPDERLHDRLSLPRKRPYWSRMYATGDRVCATCQVTIGKGEMLWISRGTRKEVYCESHRPPDPKRRSSAG